MLRAELTRTFGVRFGEIITGQADVLGIPDALLDTFSKRAHEVATALEGKLTVFATREGREPTLSSGRPWNVKPPLIRGPQDREDGHRPPATLAF